jgi:hypothetical protein
VPLILINVKASKYLHMHILNLATKIANCQERTEETQENLSRGSRAPGRELYPRPPEYEAGLLSPRSRSLVEPCLQQEHWCILFTIRMPVIQTCMCHVL